MIHVATDLHRVPFAAIAPDRDAVLELQGVPRGAPLSPRIEELRESANEVLGRVARPVGIVQGIGHAEFAAIYVGEGRNEVRTPVGDIHPRAEALALFAVTLGAAIGREIEARFAANDLALGAMLDAAASVAADNLAAAVEARWAAGLDERAGGSRGGRPAEPPGDRRGDRIGDRPGARPGEPLAVLRYSPGYCGWHVTGQRRLFHALRPERIEITLGPSCLMQPLKSVSGVLIAGTRRIHAFKDDYPFCDQCETHGCRERLRALYATHRATG